MQKLRWGLIGGGEGSQIGFTHRVAAQLEGNFYFLKPYQSKFDYDNENETVITNKSLLRIVDKEGYQINSYPIGNNIIKI